MERRGKRYSDPGDRVASRILHANSANCVPSISIPTSVDATTETASRTILNCTTSERRKRTYPVCVWGQRHRSVRLTSVEKQAFKRAAACAAPQTITLLGRCQIRDIPQLSLRCDRGYRVWSASVVANESRLERCNNTVTRHTHIHTHTYTHSKRDARESSHKFLRKCSSI